MEDSVAQRVDQLSGRSSRPSAAWWHLLVLYIPGGIAFTIDSLDFAATDYLPQLNMHDTYQGALLSFLLAITGIEEESIG